MLSLHDVDQGAGGVQLEGGDHAGEANSREDRVHPLKSGMCGLLRPLPARLLPCLLLCLLTQGRPPAAHTLAILEHVHSPKEIVAEGRSAATVVIATSQLHNTLAQANRGNRSGRRCSSGGSRMRDRRILALPIAC